MVIKNTITSINFLLLTLKNQTASEMSFFKMP